MDIHRCRFVSFPASPINAVAFSHPFLDSKRAARLAIGRSNGDIEIWNPQNGDWLQETILHGGRDRSVDGLVWVVGADEQLSDGTVTLGKLRLFSIGYTSTVTEWDLEKGRAKKHANGQHGDIWCLAAQPAASKEQAVNGMATTSRPQRLVAGTIDGSLVLYSIEDDDLQFQRVLVKTAKKDIKMLSITLQSRQVAVVGCSDSSIRVYDLRRGVLLRNMTLGKDLEGGSKDIIVWSVKYLRNGDIVSGDSTGQIVIWDGKTYTQAQRIQGHKHDVLSLATSHDGKSIVSGGMDRRTALYRPVTRDSSRWQRIWYRKYHDHDVKAMASFEGKGMSVVVSGGPDATPVVTPLRQAGVENHRTLSHLPQSVPLQSAPEARIIVSWWDREVHIWKLCQPMKDLVDNEKAEENIERNHKLLGRILIKGESNIASASISRDGSLLCLSTVSAIKAFHLTTDIASPRKQISIRKVHLPTVSESSGSNLVRVSPNGQWLCWIQEGTQVFIARILRGESSDKSHITTLLRPAKLIRLRRDVPKVARLSGLGLYDRRVTHAAFSPDSSILATADLAGYIDTWILSESFNPSHGDDASSSASSNSSNSDEDEEKPPSGPRWVRNPNARLLPKLPQAPVVLSFSDTAIKTELLDDPGDSNTESILLAVTSTSHIYTYYARKGTLTHWSRRNGVSKLPNEIRATRDIIKGAVWQGPRVWLYSASFLFMLDLSLDFTDEVHKHKPQSKPSKKRKRGADSGAGSKTDAAEALVPQHVRVALADGANRGEWVDVEMVDAEEPAAVGVDVDDDENEDEEGGELQQLRDRETSAAHRNGETDRGRKRKKWWFTYKYRPILGMVPLVSGDQRESKVRGAETNGANEKGRKQTKHGDFALSPIEVALVERPKWDVAMPARYVEE